MSSTIGLIGLGSMGAALARNIAGRSFAITVYNRTTQKTDAFVRQYGNEFLDGVSDIKKLVESLEAPRKIIVMVQAGRPVDEVIEELLPLLDDGDIIIDCGNSNYRDTARRAATLAERGNHFIGCGVSGGEEGALHGPSMMVGGAKDAWQKIRQIFEAITARDFSGGPCVAYFGEDGAGHYVKMAHNGIEYAVMQIMAEAYELLRSAYQLKAPDIAKIFADFNKGKLKSYLFEISVPILSKKDELTKGYLIDLILDKAGQKGTGRWTSADAVERGVAIPSIAEAVFARTISSEKEKRATLAKQYRLKHAKPTLPLKKFIPLLEDALYAALISSYAQGYDLIARAATEEKWDISLAEVSRIWGGGCIIRAKLLNTLHKAYGNTKENERHLLSLSPIVREVKKHLPALQEAVALSAKYGASTPSLSASLAYILNMTTANGPTNLIQCLRDYFGAHTYERTDREGNFHTDWGNYVRSQHDQKSK